MSIITIFLFFVYTIGLGHGLLLLFNIKIDGFLERIVIKIGVGLSTFVVLGLILNLSRIPIDWKIILIISLLGPLYSLLKEKKRLTFTFPKKFKKSTIYSIILLGLFFFTLYMHTTGAFAYPWLEDGDPWTHLMGTKYVALEKTVFEPNPEVDFFFYMDPYPAGYDLLMGVLHQTSSDIIWTLKFFNALILALAILFSFYLFKKITGSGKKAILATFILAMLPSFMSHFIWAHSLVITLLPLIFYAAFSIQNDEKWVYVTGIILGSTTLIQPTQPIKFIALFFIFAVVKIIHDKKQTKNMIKVLLIGGLIGLIWWGPIFLQPGDVVENFLGRGLYSPDDTRVDKPFFGVLGTATRLYTFDDFFVAKKQNMINNPVGWGIFATILLTIGILGILSKYHRLNPKKEKWELFIILWFIFGFAGLFGGTVLPVALFSFRFWALVSIPMALIAAEGWFFISRFIGKQNFIKLVVFCIIITGLIFTSGVQKYAVNTALWYPDSTFVQYGQFSEYLETGKETGYVYLKTLPPSQILYACNHEFFYPNAAIIAYGHENCFWCDNVLEFQTNFFNMTSEQIRIYMDNTNSDYLMFDGVCTIEVDEQTIQDKISEISNGGFQLVHQTQGFLLFRRPGS
jgi:hypothetical protein